MDSGHTLHTEPERFTERLDVGCEIRKDSTMTPKIFGLRTGLPLVEMGKTGRSRALGGRSGAQVGMC